MRFDSYHPTINLIYFVAAFAMVIAFRHPAYLLISYVAIFLYSLKLRGKRALVLDLALIPLIAVYAFIYSSYHHFGVTNLGQNFIGNQITLESVVYGCAIGVRIASGVMLASCMFVIVSADKVVYLFGRISPKLSLFLAILRSLRSCCAASRGSGREENVSSAPGAGSGRAAFREMSCKGCFTFLPLSLCSSRGRWRI